MHPPSQRKQNRLPGSRSGLHSFARELHPAATMLAGAAFLRSVIAAFPYKLHTVLTDNGTPFADQPRYRSGPTARYRLPPGRFSL